MIWYKDRSYLTLSYSLSFVRSLLRIYLQVFTYFTSLRADDDNQPASTPLLFTPNTHTHTHTQNSSSHFSNQLQYDSEAVFVDCAVKFSVFSPVSYNDINIQWTKDIVNHIVVKVNKLLIDNDIEINE